MKTLQVGELKAKFSKILEDVKNGEEIGISFGKKKETIAVIVPYSKYKKKNKVKLGLLEGKGRCVIHDDFTMTDEEFFNS